MQSRDLVSDNIQFIAERWPECLTEAKDENGKLRQVIDFDKLRQVLSSDAVGEGQERYQFTWPDKRHAIRLANAPITDTLRPVRKDETTPTGADSSGKPYCSTGSVDFDNTQNLYIEGDNLNVLKLLRENYLGKVKMIYIDPPYNTGGDFVYKDNFIRKNSDYKDVSGSYDEEGNLLVGELEKNTDANGRFHTDWLNMIYSRLKVARDLLSEDGVVFISIDDNEEENLKKICNEIFGQDNFVAQLVWQQGRKSAGKTIATNHEYCVIFAKSLSIINAINSDSLFYWKKKKEGLEYLYNEEMMLRKKYGNDYEAINKEFKNFLRNLSEDNPAINHKHYRCIDENGIYFPADASAPDNPDSRCHKPLIHPITGKPCCVPRSGWRYKEYTLDEMYRNGLFHFGDDETTIPCVKRYLKNTEYEVAQSVFYKDGRGASNRLATLFGKKIFDFPKDEEIIEEFVKLSCLEFKDSIILDFFSGSATTAHAVM